MSITNKTIWELKIECCEVIKKCEIDSSYELEDLCQFILESFDFENDHLHKFYFSRSGRPYGQDVIDIHDNDQKLSELLPREDRKQLFLLFDFGDEWVFRIVKTRKKVSYNSDVEYPIITEEIGENPEQYPNYNEE